MSAIARFGSRMAGIAALAAAGALVAALAPAPAAHAQQPATEVRQGADGSIVVVLPDGSEIELEPGRVDDLGGTLETLPGETGGLTPVGGEIGGPELFEYGTSQLGLELQQNFGLTYNARMAVFGEGPVEGAPDELQIDVIDDGGGLPLSGLNEFVSDTIEGVDRPEPASPQQLPSNPNAN
jgi:hypothetical protein